MAGTSQSKSFYLAALRFLLRPIIQFCLRSALSFQDLLSAAKVLYVELAEAELQRTNCKVNVSRISVITGLHRKDVTEHLSGEHEQRSGSASVFSKVIGQWENDKRFLNKAGEPRVLSLEGQSNEFRELVETVTTAIHPATVAFELVRTAAAEKTARGLKLIRSENLVIGDQTLHGYELLGKDIGTLIAAIEENLVNRDMISNLHIRTDYDNIYVKDLYKVRKWLVDQGRIFHKRARKFISNCDKDVSPRGRIDEPAGQKVSVTTFSLTGMPLERPKTKSS